jgi:accessory colonization factor AcfC
MKRVYNLIVLCILLICQQHIIAQSYNLGKQKQSFAYKTLYASYEQGSQVIINNNQPVNAQNAQDVINRHRQIVQLINNLAGQSTSKYTVCDVYMKIYQSYQKAQDKFLQLQEIQNVVITYLRNNKTIYPNLENQLKNASSMEEEIAVFLSYYKE